MKKALLLVVLLMTANCAHYVPTAVSIPAPEHEILYRAGLDAFRMGTPEGYQHAAESFRKAANLRPSHCEYSLHLAESLLSLAQEQKLNWQEFQPRVAEAKTILDSVPSIGNCSAYESAADRVRAIYEAEFETSGKRTALQLINHTVVADPADPLNWLTLWKLSSSTNLTVSIPLATKLGPDWAAIQYEFGNYELIRGEYAEARKAFERALEISPGHFRAVIGLAYAVGSADITAPVEERAPRNEADVESLYRRAIDISPDYLEGRTLLGNYYAGMEETEKAIEQYRDAVHSNAAYFPGYLALGVALLNADRFGEAGEAFRTVVTLNPQTFEAYYYLGNIALNDGDLAKAKAQYEDCLKYRVNYPEAIYALGIVFYREGKIDDALAQYDKAIKLNPQYGDAFLSRGSVRGERRQFADAISDYGRAVEIYQQEIMKYESDAQKSYSMGFTRKATAERKRAREAADQMNRAVDLRKAAQEQVRPPMPAMPDGGGNKQRGREK